MAELWANTHQDSSLSHHRGQTGRDPVAPVRRRPKGDKTLINKNVGYRFGKLRD